MKKQAFFPGRGILAAVIIIGLVFGVLTHAKAAVSFKGRVISIIVPFTAGGGTDMFGRLLSRHIGKFLPGKPSIVVRNIPGGENVIGSNLAWAAKPNGLTLLATSGSTVMLNILRPKGTEYKLEEMYPIYASPSGLVYWARPDLVKEPKDVMKAKGIIYGHVSPTGGTGSGFVWAKELLGFKVEKFIWGYGGGAAARGAYLQGELNTAGESTLGFHSAMRSYVAKGEAVPIFQSGIMDEDGNVVREPAAPDVPTPPELYEQVYGKKPSGQVFEAYKLMVGSRTYGKTLVLPPKTPREVVDMYHAAAAKMVKDPKFLDEAEKLNPGSPHFVGKGLVRTYPAGVSGPPEVIQFMKKVLSENYGVVFD